MKPVCVKCACFYRPKRNGFALIEGKPDGIRGDLRAEEIRGHRCPAAWTPYKLWRGDLWECPDCEHQIVVGFAYNPLAEHYQPDFAQKVQEVNARLQVNDC